LRRISGCFGIFGYPGSGKTSLSVHLISDALRTAKYFLNYLLMRQMLTVLLFFLLSPAGRTQIVINEVNIAGTGEFIELYNKSSCTKDLTCYTITFSSTSGSGNPTGWTVKIPSGKSIPACGYFLIGGSSGTAGIAGGTGYPNGGTSTPYSSADLNIGTNAITANAVYMKQGLSAGTLPNSSGQINLLDPSNSVVASVSYNNGNNSSTYPLSAYITCNASGNTQGVDNIPDPGASANNINATFASAGPQGIYLNASNVYVTTAAFTPGSANLSQIGCAPSIITSLAASPICFSSSAQQTTLSYSSTTNSPTQYSITWDAMPANTFAPVTNAGLPTSAILITVPASTLAGTYTGYLSVTNASGVSCAPVPFSVTVNPLPTVSAGSYGPLCTNSTVITLTGSPAGGVFSGTSVSGNSFTPPGSGTYTIQYGFSDASTGCSNTATTTILIHPQPVIDVTPSSAAICQNSGIALTASGGSTYSWSPLTGLSGATGNSVTANPSFNTVYTVTGTDGNGCSNFATATITVSLSPSAPQVALVQPTCIIAGSIEVISPTGPGLTYSIDGASYLNNGGMFTNIVSGNYTVTVKNAAGCVSPSANVVINPLPGAPSPPTVFVQQPSCGVSVGMLTITSPTGAGLSYSIDGINYQSSTVFSNLSAGNYTVTVKNTSGCIVGISVVINLPPSVPPTPTITVINNCDGTSTLTANGVTGTLLWSNGATGNPITVTSGGTYYVAQSINGCTSNSGSAVAIPAQQPQTPVVSIVQPTCTSATGSFIIISPAGSSFVYSLNSSPFTSQTNYSGLSPNNYTLVVRNFEGCTVSATVTIDPQPQIPLAPAIIITQPTCTSSTGTISVSSSVAGYSYSIDGVSYSNTSGIFSNLLPGTYNVTAKNNEGCVSTVTQATVNMPPVTPAVQVNSPVVCPGATATIIASATPLGSYSYTWAVPTGAVNPGNAASFSASVAGTYIVTVITGDGCINTASGTLSINALVGSPAFVTGAKVFAGMASQVILYWVGELVVLE